jgi:hypothetical protein
MNHEKYPEKILLDRRECWSKLCRFQELKEVIEAPV